MTSSRIFFHAPELSENRVKFTWESPVLSNLFRDGRDFVELQYHQQVKLDSELAYNQLMAMFFPILHGAIQGDVLVEFAETLPKDQIQRWMGMHSLHSIQNSSLRKDSIRVVSPMSEDSQPKERLENPPDGGIALLYGGGKDSLGALSLFSRLYPEEKLSLLRIHWSRQSVSRHRSIFNENVIDLLQDRIDFDYLECSSTLHINLKDRKTAYHVGINFYHACCLPYYANSRFKIVNYSYDALEFFTSPTMGYLSLRPEQAKETTNILHGLGIPSSIRNISFGIPSFVHFDIILSDERGLIPITYMCEDTNERWCHNCRKCLTFALLCLEAELTSAESGIDYSRLFSSTGYFGIKVQPVLEQHVNTYSPILAYKAQFSSLRHLLSNINPNSLIHREILSEEQGGAVQSLVDLYALEFPLTRKVWARAVQVEDPLHYSLMLNHLRKIGISCFEGDSLILENEKSCEYSFNSN